MASSSQVAGTPIISLVCFVLFFFFSKGGRYDSTVFILSFYSINIGKKYSACIGRTPNPLRSGSVEELAAIGSPTVGEQKL